MPDRFGERQANTKFGKLTKNWVKIYIYISLPEHFSPSFVKNFLKRSWLVGVVEGRWRCTVKSKSRKNFHFKVL